MNTSVERSSSHRRRALGLSGWGQEIVKHWAVGCLVRRRSRARTKDNAIDILKEKLLPSRQEVVSSCPRSL